MSNLLMTEAPFHINTSGSNSLGAGKTSTRSMKLLWARTVDKTLGNFQNSQNRKLNQRSTKKEPYRSSSTLLKLVTLPPPPTKIILVK